MRFLYTDYTLNTW